MPDRQPVAPGLSAPSSSAQRLASSKSLKAASTRLASEP